MVNLHFGVLKLVLPTTHNDKQFLSYVSFRMCMNCLLVKFSYLAAVVIFLSHCHCILVKIISYIEIFGKFFKHPRVFQPNSTSRVSEINYTQSKIRLKIHNLLLGSKNKRLLYNREVFKSSITFLQILQICLVVSADIISYHVLFITWKITRKN